MKLHQLRMSSMVWAIAGVGTVLVVLWCVMVERRPVHLVADQPGALEGEESIQRIDPSFIGDSRSQSGHSRPLTASHLTMAPVDGSGFATLSNNGPGDLHQASVPEDVLQARRTLGLISVDDATRNDALDLLRSQGSSTLIDDIRAILRNPAEGDRFRSFAVQHLGLIWSGTALGPEHDALRADLRLLLADKAIPVRREALFALVRGDDAEGLEEAARVLASDAPVDGGLLDLAIRIAVERQERSALPRLRKLLDHAEAAVRTAAAWGLGQFRDAEARDGLAKAAGDADVLVADAARAALALLDMDPDGVSGSTAPVDAELTDDAALDMSEPTHE